MSFITSFKHIKNKCGTQASFDWYLGLGTLTLGLVVLIITVSTLFVTSLLEGPTKDTSEATPALIVRDDMVKKALKNIDIKNASKQSLPKNLEVDPFR